MLGNTESRENWDSFGQHADLRPEVCDFNRFHGGAAEANLQVLPGHPAMTDAGVCRRAKLRLNSNVLLQHFAPDLGGVVLGLWINGAVADAYQMTDIARLIATVQNRAVRCLFATLWCACGLAWLSESKASFTEGVGHRCSRRVPKPVLNPPVEIDLRRKGVGNLREVFQ